LKLFVAVLDEGAMKNAENVRIYFNIIIYKLAYSVIKEVLNSNFRPFSFELNKKWIF